MRIAFFTETYYPTPDGVSHYLHEVKRGLEARGHEVFVFTLTGQLERNVVRPLSVPMFWYRQYRWPVNFFPFILYKKMKDVNPDVIHIHDPFYMGTLGYRLARELRRPIVATFHTDFSKMMDAVSLPMKETLFRISWRYNMYLYRRCDAVLAPSPKAAELLRSNGAGNVRVLPLFTDLSRFTWCRRESVRPFLAYIGRLTVDKGVWRAVEIARELGRSVGGTRLMIAGTGPEEERLKESVPEYKEAEIEFLGYVSEEEKQRILRESYFFVYPSTSDTFGISVLEAMATGLPAVVTPGFPLLDFTGSGDCTILHTEPPETAGRIRALLENPSSYMQLSEGARQFVESNFSSEAHIESLLSIYSSIRQKTK